MLANTGTWYIFGFFQLPMVVYLKSNRKNCPMSYILLRNCLTPTQAFICYTSDMKLDFSNLGDSVLLLKSVNEICSYSMWFI